MNITPLNMPRRRPAAVPMAEVVYTTTTGDRPRDLPCPTHREDLYGPFCFVCGRPTDHVAEHPGLVEAGLAAYEADGSVVKTAAWNDDEAARISAAEFERYLAELASA